MVKKGFPAVHFYDQDFVDLYEQTWAWVQDAWYRNKEQNKNGLASAFLAHPDDGLVQQFEACFSSFFLAYSNRIFPANLNLDNFYGKQEESGAIRGAYRIEDGSPVFTDDNPEGIQPPLFSYAEYNLFHKGGNKKRIKEVVPILQRYFSWLEEHFRRENGLYAVPLEATRMENAPREDACYPVDFNTQQAINALYLSALGDILNDKELSFTYKRHYFSLKTRINSLMWDEKSGFYYDLDRNEKRLKVKTIAAFWTLLAEIPNEAKASRLIDHLKNPNTFGVDHPFPSLAADEQEFDENGAGCRGSVYPAFNMMIIKGLEKYARYELAREAAIRHLYYVLDTLHPEGREEGNVWEAYLPKREGPAQWEGNEDFPKARYLPLLGLSTITLMIENVLGLFISLPRKTVDWIMPNLEIMGIENLSLKRNIISILTNKSNRGWEVRLESEKLYYFTINILDENKKKTLPIPSGKCSMLIEKM
jgi:neutral trehalase